MYEYILALRNFFAALNGTGVVGINLVSALAGVHILSKQFLGIDARMNRSTAFICKYVQTLKFDDCRFMRAYCTRLLAWCEQIQWDKGFVETFIHCVGMFGYGGADEELLSVLPNTTKELLLKSRHKQLQIAYALESVLADFDIVGGRQNSNPQDIAALNATKEFKEFLLQHYKKQFGQWPPQPIIEDGLWLTRPIAQQLQDDFGALYDLLVDDTLASSDKTHTSATLCRVFDDGTVEPITNMETVHSSKFAFQEAVAKWNHRCGHVSPPCPFPKMPTLYDTSHTPSAMIVVNEASFVPALRGQDSEAAHHRTLADAYSQAYNGNRQCLTPATDNQD